MKENVKEKQRKVMMRVFIFLGIISVIVITLLSISPDRQEAVIAESWGLFIEMIFV